MDMSMTPTQNGTHRAQLLGLSPTVSPATTPVSLQNSSQSTHPVQSPYTASEYSQPEDLPSHSERHHPASPRVFLTNGVKYPSQPAEPSPGEVAHSVPEVEPMPTGPSGAAQPSEPVAPSGVRFALPEATPSPPLGPDAFSPVHHPSGEVIRSGTTSKPEPRTITTHHHPLGALSRCCSTSRPGTPPRTSHDHHHASRNGSGSGSSHSPSHSPGTCCSKSHISSEDSLLKYSDDPDEKIDVELGPPNFERTVLRIGGLKCGCCEGGLSRAVSRIPAIRNYQVNVVLARVEFDLDTNRLSVAKVIKLLSTRTGYSFEEQITSDGQVLEFIITDPRLIANASPPHGVVRVEAPTRASWKPLQLLGRGRQAKDPRGASASTTAHPEIRLPPTKIHYDPTLIGAREVHEHYLKHDPDLRLAPLVAHPGLELGAKQTRRALKWFLPTLALTIPVVVLAWAPIDHPEATHDDVSTSLADWHAHVSLALASIVQLIALREFVPSAVRSLYHNHVFEMDFLIAVSTTIAYVFSVVSYAFLIRGTPLETGTFFETSTLLVTLILLGRVINEFARFRAAKSVSFRSLQVNDALIVTANPSWAHCKVEKIDSRLLQYGDTFQVPPHTKIVTDGIVLYGGSNVDESMITGESKPKAKGLHSEVFAGTTNGDGILVVRLLKLPHENSIQQIATMVEDAELTKPKAQALADRIAGWFVPAIATLGLTVFLIWLFVDRFYNNRTWGNSVVTALTYGIATLIVSCPCAIGLAVPMVVLIAGGVAARFGIIFRDPQKLEIARSVTDVVFDKTGTLTCGMLEVVGVPKYIGADHAHTKGLLLGLVKDIKHPISVAISRHLAEAKSAYRDFVTLQVTDITSVPGCGVEGTCAETGAKIRAGNSEWLNINVIGRETHSRCYMTINGDLRASFELQDRIRPTAETVIEKLYERGIKVHMISGDNEGAVDAIAHALHIKRRRTKTRCKPEGKMNYVKDLQKPGKVVMFVGDGTNDSVALKQADVGVHVNQGSDVAKSAADVVLMTTRLHDVLILLDISRAAYRRIIINFAWSALYNLLAVLLAAGAFVKAGDQIRIKPQWAGLGELVSVLPVVLIAFQMRWRSYGNRYSVIESDYQKAEAPKRERKARSRLSASSTSETAGCCEISAVTLAKIDAVTR